MADCRAAVITALNQPLEIQRVPLPDLEPTALLCRVEAATLCGTDVHRWHGALTRPDMLPFIPGHETCGVIEAMHGPRTDLLGAPLKVGDRILWAYPSCGRCYWCTVARQPSICPEIRYWGCNRSDQYPYLLGGCAEYQYVPPRCDIIRVPEEVSSPLAAAAACAYRTVMHGFDRLGPIHPHETVLVQGSGPLGLFAAAVARDHSAYRVLMIGAPEARLRVAQDMGVDAALDLEDVPDPAQRRQWVLDQVGGGGRGSTSSSSARPWTPCPRG
jgi:D-arabinose 1-dehydrogenase-like Zn-dependent alcohol dehydrogenase